MKFAVSLMATEATDAEGRVLERGGEIELDPDQREEQHNARLIAEGQLIAVASPKKSRQAAQDKVDALPSASAPPGTMTQEGGADQ
jgi:hypothetical protein